jgi:hypothetical protein
VTRSGIALAERLHRLGKTLAAKQPLQQIDVPVAKSDLGTRVIRGDHRW